MHRNKHMPCTSGRAGRQGSRQHQHVYLPLHLQRGTLCQHEPEYAGHQSEWQSTLFTAPRRRD